MLFTGILLGPYVLNLLDPSILSVSADLRQLALVIILMKAGLSLNLGDLKRVGRPALLMSCLPATFEILAYTLLAPVIFGVSWVEGAVMGAVLGAVSPAVVVPRMVTLMDGGWGTEKSIPQMILAGSSMDDVYVIVLFSTFVGMAQGGTVSLSAFAGIPISILLGIAVGAGVGWLLAVFFEYNYKPPSPHPQQHQGHHPPGHCLPPAGGGGLAGGDGSLLRHPGPSPPWPAASTSSAPSPCPPACPRSSASCGWQRR